MRPVTGFVVVLACLAGLLCAGAASAQDPSPPVESGPDGGDVGRDDADDPAAAQARAAESARLAAEVVAARQAAQPHLTRAFDLLGRHEWEACIAPFRAAAERLAPHPLLGGLHDQCLYNVACALARSGRPAEAVEALRESLAHGLRDLFEPGPEGRVTLARGLTLPHVLADTDLDPLRDRDDFRGVIRPLLEGGDVVVEATASVEAGPSPGRVPGVVVLLRTDGTLASEGEAWRRGYAATAPAIMAFVEGPVRPGGDARRWLLTDGEVRFGVRKAAAALDALRADPRVDPSRLLVVAAGPAAAEVAWALAFERPADVASLVLGPSRFHAAWHAEALASLRESRRERAPWRVRLVGQTPRAAELLGAAGALVDETEAPDVPAEAPPLERYAALRAVVIQVAGLALRND